MIRGRLPDDPGPPPGSARLAALRLLARRDYSAAEIAARLSARGHDREDVEAAIEALTTEGSIDDTRAARAHVHTAASVKRRGSLRIRRELEARGFGADAVREALADLTRNDDLAAIRRFLARRPLPDPLTRDARRRLVQQLLRRGFPADLVARAFDTPADED